MTLNEDDKKKILQYLNEGVSLMRVLGKKYDYTSSEIQHLMKILGYNIIFNTEINYFVDVQSL